MLFSVASTPPLVPLSPTASTPSHVNKRKPQFQIVQGAIYGHASSDRRMQRTNQGPAFFLSRGPQRFGRLAARRETMLLQLNVQSTTSAGEPTRVVSELEESLRDEARAACWPGFCASGRWQGPPVMAL